LNLLQLTIAQRLWLGLGVILGLFGVAHIVSLGAARQLDQVLSTVVSAGQARAAAMQSMKIQLDALERSVRAYLASGAPQHRARAEVAGESFQRALAQYGAPPLSSDLGALVEETRQLYSELSEQAQLLTRQKSGQAHALDAHAEHLHALRALLATMPSLQYASRQTPPVQNQVAAEELRSRLNRHLATVRPDAAAAAEPRITRRALARYRQLAQTREERLWAARVDRWLVEERAQLGRLEAAMRAQQPALARFAQLRVAIDGLLDNSLQPAVRLQTDASLRQASTTLHEANALAARVLVLALALGVLAALVLARSVRAPLRALVASTRRLGRGDHAYRLPVGGRDELGELTDAFNEMAAQLQASTVSRSYMESVLDSMGEALFVVRADGVIESANPAAQRLLGYEAGQLSGVPFAAIATVESAEVVRTVPARLDAVLKTRDGGPIPVALSAVPMPRRGAEPPAVVCIAQDLRERLAAAQHQRQTAVAFENTREGVVLTDAAGNVITVNPAFAEITGYALPEVEGRGLELLWAREHQRRLSSHIWREVAQRGQWQGEIWLRRKGGEVRPVWKNISVVRDAAGEVVNHVAVFSDITAIKDAEERLNYLAYHDSLTDLPNRLLLHDRLSAALDRAVRSASSVALLYLDLDNFKHVNDTLGHEEGDRLLQAMAGRIGACVGGTERVARLGGDEFVVIEEDVRDPRQAAQLASRILESLSGPVVLAGLELRMRASIGISLGPQHGGSADALLKAADAAMYRAKRGASSGYEFFSEEMTQQARERLTLEAALRHPSLGEQLLLHYQPQVEISTGRLVGVEALVRWMHPERGLLLPGVFVPVAEDAGLAPVIGAWVLRRACRQAREWTLRGRKPVRMSVNVSAYQLRDDRIVEAVAGALRDSGLPPAQLELEITEGALQTQGEAESILDRLKSLGVQLALDDFGTGYSTLSSLKLLPFDRLKIDRSFVRSVEEDANDRALTRAIIAMARSLDLDIIAEGVETPGQLAFLRKEGCSEMQGYLVSAPLAADELERALLSPAGT
jgi:diguanylate cyclase (GGDEF)-like protein/PAS domain S-box-containing protein